MKMYRRLSPVTINKGVRRPEVGMVQAALNACGYDAGPEDNWLGGKGDRAIRAFQDAEFGKNDGDFGRVSSTRALERAAAAGWTPPLGKMVQAMICYQETSGTRNAYGDTSWINDGAGVNYGVLQHNSHGSLVRVLKDGGRSDLANMYRANDKDTMLPDIRDWMQSVDGIAAQDAYYERTVTRLANRIWDQLAEGGVFGEEWPLCYVQRLRLMLADCITQNGALWSPNRRPFWKTITDAEARVKKYRELHEGVEFDAYDLCLISGRSLTYGTLKSEWGIVVRSGLEDKRGDAREAINRATMISLLSVIPGHEDKLTLIAQMRARSSNPKWWRAVEDGQMFGATGEGRVNGAKLDLVADFGFAPEPELELE